MTEPKDETIEREELDGQAAEDERKLTLSEELEQIFLNARDAVVPGTGIDQRRRDLDSALAAFSVINSLPMGAPFMEIRRKLLTVQLTSAIRNQIALACPELNIGIEDIRDHQQEMALRYVSLVDENGFLKNMVESRADAIRPLLTEEICNELNRLEAEVARFLGNFEASGLAHLLFYCLDGDFERVQAIVQAQIKSYRNVEQLLAHDAVGDEETVPTPPSFPRQLASFLREFGYISQFLLDNSEYPNGMEERSRNALTTVFRHPSLTYVRRGQDEPGVNLNQILFELSTPNGVSKTDQFINPWFQGDLKQTPFDSLKVRNILRMSISYQDKARILLAINKYALEGEATTTTLIGTQKTSKVKKKSAKVALTPEALLLGKTFLALLHPKCIVKNRAVQVEFMDIVKSLERDERLKGDSELAQSISTLLHTEDPFLDIPMRECRNKSIRELLMNLCFEYFDDEVISNGLPIQGETVRLFPLPDAEELVVSQEVPLSRYFNTAFVGIERGFLSKVAEAMVTIYSFDEIIRFAKKEAQHYFRTNESDKQGYRFYFYESASDAFRDVIRKCFFTENTYKKTDYNVIATNQEFRGITEMFQKNEGRDSNYREDSQDPGLRVVRLNHDDPRRPKTVDELFQDISERVDKEKTKIILISSQTRFGDTPCSSPDHPSGYQLAQLVRKLKSAYPDIAVAIDACQAIGRTRGDSLKGLGADIYFTSGIKALGVTNANKGSVAMVALSNRFLRKQEPNRFSARYYGTMPIANIAAQALAMRMLRSKIDLSRMEGNLGENRKLSLEQKIANHIGKLTQAVIERADQYGESFVAEDLPRIAPGLLQGYSHEELVSWMGCRVHYPVHRNQQDYSGIITIDFPSKSGRYILPALQAKPHKFDLGTCLYKDRALRISFHYLHEIADIDHFFAVLRGVHAELLEKDYQQGRKFRDVRNWTPR